MQRGRFNQPEDDKLKISANDNTEIHEMSAEIRCMEKQNNELRIINHRKTMTYKISHTMKIYLIKMEK